MDQPSFRQYRWSAAKKEKLQALFVTPPPGLEVGYVPIVIRQADASLPPMHEMDLTELAGHYRRHPVENDWHVGRISVEKREKVDRQVSTPLTDTAPYERVMEVVRLYKQEGLLKDAVDLIDDHIIRIPKLVNEKTRIFKAAGGKSIGDFKRKK